MASEMEMPTKHGDPVKLAKLDDDILMPSFFPNVVEKLASIKDMEHRPDDVLLCTYPKSGTHWVGNVIQRILLTGVEEAKKENYKVQFLGLIEMAPPEQLKDGVSPRIMASHLQPKRLPTAYLEGKAKIVLVVRNPKDVAVSFYYHLKNMAMISNKQDWNEYFESYQSGEVPFRGCLDYIKAWEAEIKSNKSLDIAIVYFEELKTNGVETVKKLANHLGCGNLGDEQLHAILEDCSLAKLKTQDAQQKNPAKQRPVDKDGQSIIYRKGKVADGKNHFTVAQNERFEEIIRRALDGSMFTFRYE